MKRLSKIITMLLVVFLVTGCVRRKINMNISRNGEIELTAIIAYADSANMTVSESDKAKYKSNGFKVEDYNQDEYKGVKISKKFKISEVSSDSEVKFSLKDLEETAKPIMFQKIGNKKYKANFVLDTRTSDGQSGSGVDISYTVTLPNKPISHNANSVDGNTLTWTADLGEEKAINYEFSLGGISTSLIIIGIIVVAAVAIVIVVIVMGKKNKQNPNMSSFGNEVPVVPEVDVPVTPTVPITYNDINAVSSGVSMTPVMEPATTNAVPQTNVEVTPVEIPNPVAETPAAEIPNPVVETSETEIPNPVVETSETEIPNPSVETPVAEIPNPVVETPVAEIPNPVVENPTEEASVSSETSVSEETELPVVSEENDADIAENIEEKKDVQ